MKKIKVLHLRSSGGFFGAEGVIFNLAKELEKMDVENFIVCINNLKNPHTELAEKAKEIGVKAFSIDCRGRFDLNTIKELRKILKKYHIQILHCHDYKANFFGFLASRGLGMKLITTLHSWREEGVILKIYEYLDSLVILFFDRIVCVSKEIANILRKKWLYNNKISIVFNGIDIKKYSSGDIEEVKRKLGINSDYKVIGAVGRISLPKGFDYYIEAAKEVIKNFNRVLFLIVGDGCLRKELEEKAKKSGLEKKIIFLGRRENMEEIYSILDIFVLSSIREGLPLVLLEALAMKKPVIATSVGGVPEVISSSTGILVPSKNSKALANAILELLTNETKAQFLAENGRRLIEKKFSSTVMAERYKEIYRELLEKK